MRAYMLFPNRKEEITFVVHLRSNTSIDRTKTALARLSFQSGWHGPPPTLSFAFSNALKSSRTQAPDLDK